MQKVVIYLKKIIIEGKEKKEQEKELSRCAWELFRLGLMEQYGLDGAKEKMERSRHGKPYLVEHPGICFNLSHSGAYAACAFAGIPVGLDLQEHRPVNRERMAERYFSKKDQERIAASADPETLFFQIWTEEESYGKWKGTGLCGGTGREKKGFCTHFCPEKGYEGAVWAGEEVSLSFFRACEKFSLSESGW